MFKIERKIVEFVERNVNCRLPSKTAICAMFGGQCVT